MEKLKKIWLWISGGIVALFGVVFLFMKLISGSKEKRDFKKKNRELEKEKKQVDKKIDDVNETRDSIKEDIKNLQKEIERKNGELSKEDTQKAVDILREFKKKHKK